jgi:hypothetical protein
MHEQGTFPQVIGTWVHWTTCRYGRCNPSLGVAKHRELGLRYPLADTVPPDAEQLTAAAEHFTRRGVRVTTT